MQIVRQTRIVIFVNLAATLIIAGCSDKVAGPQRQIQIVQGVTIAASIRPGLPQDSSSASTNDAAQTGDNTLIVQLNDATSNAPIPDANVTAAPSTDLINMQGTESGRSQGNGIYYIPIRFGVPDKYMVTVNVQRTGQRFPITTQFHFAVN
jgi:hypothetical protein